MRLLARHPVAAGAAALLACLLVTFLVPPWSDARINDLTVYRIDAAAFAGGRLPYRDVAFEYPPLAAPVLALPALLGTGRWAYAIPFALLMFAFGVAAIWAAARLASAAGGDPRLAVAALALAPLATGALIRTHFDLAPTAATLAALALFASRRAGAAGAALGVAVAVKGFPAILAPVALAWLWAAAGRREALRAAAALAATVALVCAIAVAASPAGFWSSVDYQLRRPPQVESSTAATLLAVADLGGGAPSLEQSHRSAAVAAPGAEALATGFELAGLALVALLAVRAARTPTPRSLALAALAAVTAYSVFWRVLSPQYIVWSLPLLAVALALRERLLAATVLAATVLTFVEFPFRYGDLLARDSLTVWIVFARDGLLIAAVALAARALAGERAPLLARPLFGR